MSSLPPHPYHLQNGDHSHMVGTRHQPPRHKVASKDILDVLTKVHFVQFATFQQPEHKYQIAPISF